MNNKKFEYNSKDRPFLSRDIKYRLIFLLLCLAVFVWQMALILSSNKAELSTLQIVVSILTMILSMLLILTCLLYISKSVTALQSIKKKGRAVGSVLLLVKTDKSSFVKLYQKLSNILAFVISLVLISVTTYAVLQIIYLSSYSFYLPLIYLIAVSGFLSVYHIKYEISLLNNVSAYNSIY